MVFDLHDVQSNMQQSMRKEEEGPPPMTLAEMLHNQVNSLKKAPPKMERKRSIEEFQDQI